MREEAFIAALRALPLHPGALDLGDDAARLGDLVLTTDTLVEGVHYLPDDAPADVAWKLLAVNLSDLAAKGAAPEGVLLNYPLGDDAWDRAFLAGLDVALRALGGRLLGGDTVTLSAGAPRVLTLTAIGRVEVPAPARGGARPGDRLWVTGTIGDAGLGLAIRQGRATGDAALVARYLRPEPRLAIGRRIAARVHAACDVSDGLLIDAARIAAASGCAIRLDLDAVPLSAAFRAARGHGCAASLAAATAGDDYELLFAAAPDVDFSADATAIGRVEAGQGLCLFWQGSEQPLPERLGYLHGEQG